MRKIRVVVLTGIFTTLSITYGLVQANPSVNPLEEANAAQKEAILVHPEPPVAQVRVVPVAATESVARRSSLVTSPTSDVQSSAPQNTVREKEAPSSDERPVTMALLPIVDQPDIRDEDKQILNAALLWFPAICRENIDHLVVRYDPDADRGLATSRTILLRGPIAGSGQQEMIAVLFHECAHIIDLGALKGSPLAGMSPYPDGHVPTFADDPSVEFYRISWRNAEELREGVKDADLVSGYAKHDSFEDLAESIIYYAFHQQAFRERAQSNPALAQKLAWVETHIFGPYFQPLPGGGWNGKIVWDVTKIAHQLEL